MAKKSISAPEELVEIIDKARRGVLICFSESLVDWQKEKVISAITRALDRKVPFFTLAADDLINPSVNPVYRYLKLKTLPRHVVKMYTTPNPPVVFFHLN